MTKRKKAKTYPLTRRVTRGGILNVQAWEFPNKRARQVFVNENRDTGFFYAVSLEDVEDRLDDQCEIIEPEEPDPQPETPFGEA